jgi:dihydroneopterin aldolase
MSESEARLAAVAGADIIDAKDPASGALGALSIDTVCAIRATVPAHIPVSATIGDLPMTPAAVTGAAGRMAATGVDIVKIGLFPGELSREASLSTIEALGALAKRTKLVAVMLADLAPNFDFIAPLAQAGFCGVMLDTAGKSGKTLLDHLTPSDLKEFLHEARSLGLMSGLAGSLRASQIPELVALRPDVLGFRGALCKAHDRKSSLDPDAIRAIRSAIANPPLLAANLELERTP